MGQVLNFEFTPSLCSLKEPPCFMANFVMNLRQQALFTGDFLGE